MSSSSLNRLPSESNSFEWSVVLRHLPLQMLRRYLPSRIKSFTNDLGREAFEGYNLRMIISDPPFEGKNHLRMISVIWHSKENRLQMFCKSTNLPLTFRLHAKNEKRTKALPSFYGTYGMSAWDDNYRESNITEFESNNNHSVQNKFRLFLGQIVVSRTKIPLHSDSNIGEINQFSDWNSRLFQATFLTDTSFRKYWSLITVTQLSTQLHFALHNIIDDTILCHWWHNSTNYDSINWDEQNVSCCCETTVKVGSKEVALWGILTAILRRRGMLSSEMRLSRLGYKQVSLVKNWSSYHWAELNSPLNISCLTISCHRLFSMLLLQEAKRIFGQILDWLRVWSAYFSA